MCRSPIYIFTDRHCYFKFDSVLFFGGKVFRFTDLVFDKGYCGRVLLKEGQMGMVCTISDLMELSNRVSI